MTWQSGGGGAAPIPGLTSDGANGIIVAETLLAGNNNAVGVPNFNGINGFLAVSGNQGNIDDGDPPLFVTIGGNLAADTDVSTAVFRRSYARNGHAVMGPAVLVQESTNGVTAGIQEWWQGVAKVAEIGQQGGLGLFGQAAQVAASSITGALSAVADPAAKDVLTSIIAALTADGGATNGTT